MNSDTDLRDYHVVDGRGEDVGQVEYVWNDPQHAPEFVGVHIGFMGRTHLVPLREATIDAEQKLIRVPYHNDTIRNTRHLTPGTELTSQDRWELYDNYGLQPPAPGAPSQYHADLQDSGRTEAEDDLDAPANPV